MVDKTHDPQADATVITELARLAEKNVAATIVKNPENNREFIVRRNDFAVQEITLPNTVEIAEPKRATATVQIDTAASLIDYVNRFKNPNTVLFASETENKIVAVIDYHERADGDGKVAARLGTHAAVLELRYADEWATWTASDQRLMKHVDFATFLEENQWDVSTPNGADLLEICRDLQVKENMSFTSSVRMGDQVAVTFQKEDDVSTKQQMQLPAQFSLSIPVFFGERQVPVLCFTRRNVSDGRLVLGYKMSQRDKREADEFARIVAEVKAGVGGLETIFGRRG